MFYIYIYLDPRKKGSYSYGEYHFEYEPFYVGKGKGDRYLSHLKIANGNRKGKNNLVISKIKSILNDGHVPIILKIIEDLTKEDYNIFEKLMINIIGKSCNNLGPLLNTTDGGDGGITWSHEHHNKGKKLEELVGNERAIELRNNLSKLASERIGKLNPNFGNRGESNPNFGRKMDQSTKNKIRKKTIEQFSGYSKDQILAMIDKMNIYRKNKPDEVKQKWYDNISKTLKDKSERGELFRGEHRQKLKESNYRRLSKGSDDLKLSKDTKKKISDSLKGRIFTEEHRYKLKKCIPFNEFEDIITDLVKNKIVNTITNYREYARNNKYLKLPVRPEKSYYNDGWTTWRKYGL
jgi:hypothetical protein